MIQLNNTYSRDDFLDFLEEDFLPDFKKDIRPANAQGLSSIQKAYSLGRSESLDLQVFEFSFEGSPNKRVTLTKDAFQVMRSYAIFQALAIFHSPGSNDWRFSLMTATPERTEKGRVALTYSNPKRLSYFLGPNAKINTPTKFLLKRGNIIDFNDLKSRFSIEVVNKEFYKEISGLFTQLVGGSVQNGKKIEEFQALLKLPSIQDKSQTSLEFAVRLIGRVIFCWFLREKKSDHAKSLMPNDLLALEAVKNNPDYYHSILEPIFFEVLNKQVKSRKDGYNKEPFSSIPYLNGGLFSPQDDDFFSYNEDKQAVNHNMVVIPDEWLHKFFEALETYNFTIDENTSFDEELSIDPEMLGRIFENLLAEINPETGESARKSTGSYYTPRVIVDYMVDESLLLYLKNQTHIDQEKLRAAISYDLNDDKENQLTENERERIISALEKVKILDPACGSGAFPIGALQKIVFILQQADPEGHLWFKKQIKNTSPELRRIVEREFAHKNFDYIRKLGIIRENIYGVDIQPIATEISRLRCFLTLVVEERIQEDLENRGIEPLPNLDFKFVTANSLIGLPGSQVNSQIGLFEDDTGIRELKELRDMFFNASGTERDQLKIQFVQAQNRMFQRLISEGRRGHADLTSKLSTWDPFSHKSSSWFDPEWMFGIKEGFDVVIANPPYISLENIKENKDEYKKDYQVAAPRGDLYCLFYERSLNIAKSETGLVVFITSNKWMRAGYGDRLRNYFAKRNPLRLLDFGDLKVFDSATVNTNILFIENKANQDNLQACHFDNDYKQDRDISEYFETNKVRLKNLTNGTWFIGSVAEIALKKKIENNGTPLKRWDVKINYGIKTGYNEAFIIDQKKRDEFLTADPKCAEIIKPILRGRDIQRYGYTWLGQYIIIAKFGSYKHLQTKYPPIYQHLKKYEAKLKSRGQCQYSRSDNKKAITDFIGQHHWLELDNNPKDEYLSMFEKEKVVWIELVDSGRFAYIEPGLYTEATTFFMTAKHPKYLVGLMNSKLVNWYFDSICGESGVGTNRWKKFYVEQIPLPSISSNNQILVNHIESLVEQILNAIKINAKADIHQLEKQIDQMVYQLYGLTEDEIKVVEGKPTDGSEPEPILVNTPATTYN